MPASPARPRPKCSPSSLKTASLSPSSFRAPVSLAALTVLDVSPANQVLCAAKAGYSHVGIRLVPATPTETQWDMIGDTPMIREVEANLRATGVKVLDIEILRVKPDTRAINWKPFFETGARLGASQVLVAGNDPDYNRFCDNFAELCEIAHPYGLTLNVEPMPWCDIATVKAAGDAMKRVNRPSAGVLVDPIHFFRADNRYEDIDALPPGSLHYCQMCDITAERPKDMDGDPLSGPQLPSLARHGRGGPQDAPQAPARPPHFDRGLQRRARAYALAP